MKNMINQTLCFSATCLIYKMELFSSFPFFLQGILPASNCNRNRAASNTQLFSRYIMIFCIVSWWFLQLSSRTMKQGPRKHATPLAYRRPLEDCKCRPEIPLDLACLFWLPTARLQTVCKQTRRIPSSRTDSCFPGNHLQEKMRGGNYLFFLPPKNSPKHLFESHSKIFLALTLNSHWLAS